MTFKQIFTFYWDKRDTPCPLTDMLVEGGYKFGEYIKEAEAEEIPNPTQWWHLMHYCLKQYELHNENSTYPYTPCGELIFWMAEVSGVVSTEVLEGLKDSLLDKQDITRRQGNSMITKVCWESIKNLFNQ